MLHTSNNQYGSSTTSETMQKLHRSKVTLKELVTILIGTAIPVAIGIYTAITNQQAQMLAREQREFEIQRAKELYQQQLYKNFIDDMYLLHKNGEFNERADPWVFANARYRAAHREFDNVRKVQALRFLKERELIGRQRCTNACERENISDIVRLDGLNFDNLIISSDSLKKLNLTCVEFNDVSILNSSFSDTNLNGVILNNSRLNNTKFQDSSLNCSIIENTYVSGTNFGDSTMSGAQVVNVDYTTAIITESQKEQANLNKPTKIPTTSQADHTTTGKTATLSTMRTPSTTLTSATVTSTTTASISTNEPISTAETAPSTIATTTTTNESTTTTTNKSAITTTESTTTMLIKRNTTLIIPNLPVNATWEQQGDTVAGGNGRGGDNNQLNHPRGLFVGHDNDQTIVIADQDNYRIMQWKTGDIQGQVVAGGNSNGSRLDQLNHPSDTLVDKETDTFIVADRDNRRIVRWSRHNGTTQGEILIGNIGCYGLAVDEQRNLYVSDDEKHEVRRYEIDHGDQNGTVVAGGNGRGTGLNQLNRPRYLFVDRNQSLYVSDWNNHRVMKWDAGATQGVIVAGGQGNGTALTQLDRPYGIFVDMLGTLYVVEGGNHRVTRWPQGSEKRGTIVLGGNGKGSGANQFKDPDGLSFDKHGNLYVADYGNHRVQCFNITK